MRSGRPLFLPDPGKTTFCGWGGMLPSRIPVTISNEAARGSGPPGAVPHRIRPNKKAASPIMARLGIKAAHTGSRKPLSPSKFATMFKM